MDNLSAALRWATGHEPAHALRLAAHLGGYWIIRADTGGLGYLDAALAAAGTAADAADRGRALLFRAHMRGARQRFEMAREDTRTAVALFEEIGDEAGLSSAHWSLAYLEASLGEGADVVRRLAEVAFQHAERSGDEHLIAMALARLAAGVPHGEGERLLERAHALLSLGGNDREIARVYTNAAYTSLLEDRAAESWAYSQIARATAERVGAVAQTMFAMGNIGVAHLFLGEVAPASCSLPAPARTLSGPGVRVRRRRGTRGAGRGGCRGGPP